MRRPDSSIFFSRASWFERIPVRVDVPSFGQWVTIFYRLNFENPPNCSHPKMKKDAVTLSAPHTH